MKKILLGTLAIVSLSAVASANTQIQFPAEKLGGNGLNLIVADANVVIDGTPRGRLVANNEFIGGSPLLACFAWEYDAADPLGTGMTMEQWINDEGATVMLSDMRFTVTCANGTTQQYVRSTGYLYQVGAPFPTNLPNSMPAFTHCPVVDPCVLNPCTITAPITDFGTIEDFAAHSLTFTVHNNNVGETCPNIVGMVTENGANFTVSPDVYDIPAGGTADFTLTFQTDGVGDPTTGVVVSSDCGTLTFTVIDNVVGANETPAVFALAEAYPNPFNPSTTLSYSVPENQEVTLNVYNTSGQLVKTLVNGMVERGEHKVVFDASDLASGVYVYTLKSATQSAMHKMVLVK
jgi:hypothetical protein